MGIDFSCFKFTSQNALRQVLRQVSEFVPCDLGHGKQEESGDTFAQ